ncbi:MAG: IS1634 family transposase [Thermosynechococcaceae cyanobacterium MS004]|nr:IS1634 family transposase [Thermosynechococcaceae cyanobacterium MS004]
MLESEEVSITSGIRVENLDHLGIAAGLIDEIGIVELLNERLGIDPREKVSTGVVIKSMLLNGLGFVSAPLYLFEEFFKGKATEQLLGTGIKAEHLNDDRLGKALDELYATGLSDLFLSVSLQAAQRFEVKIETAHLDSTSFHVDGEYEDTAETLEPEAVKITYRYSRDHRPDLKQFVMNLICVGDGDIPIIMEIASGNQSDKARFAELLQDFKEQWTFEGLCIADGALYSTDNLKAMTGLQWLTRVPLSIKEASSLVNSTVALTASVIKGYTFAESSSEYGGVSQRWILIESEQRRKSDLKQLAKKIEQCQQNAAQDLQRLSTQEFACIADAMSAAQNLSKKMSWHQLCDIQTTEERHYDKAGKPRKNDIPKRISYRVTATIVPMEGEIEAQRIRCGRFILATNVLDSKQLSADDTLREYKAQQGVERGFRFLKDPMFFASSVFLKSPKRVAALGLIMALCLLVYNLGQRQLRLTLAQAAQTIPNQLGKPNASPTLRWVFQCFMAVHLVVIQGVTQVVNLTDERHHILQFFSKACQRYYLLSMPDS